MRCAGMASLRVPATLSCEPVFRVLLLVTAFTHGVYPRCRATVMEPEVERIRRGPG